MRAIKSPKTPQLPLRRSASALLVLLLAVAGRAGATAPLEIYDDQLENGCANWSWGTFNFAQTTVVHAGARAISFVPANWAGLFIHRDAGIDPSVYNAIDLSIRGSGTGGQQLKAALTSGGNPIGTPAALAQFVSGGSIPANAWVSVHIPFASLGVTSGAFDGFWLQDSTGGSQTTIYVDDIQLAPWTTPPPPPPDGGAVSVAIDPTANVRVISSLIYGVNFGDSGVTTKLKWPLNRWGGNATTRYSWDHDISNRASDWFFYNIENDSPYPAGLPNGSASDVFIDQTRAVGGQALITVPLIGWTPIDGTRRWGFSVAKYGAQQQTECTADGNASWCNADAGNGMRPDGSLIVGNDPSDTSKAVGPSYVTSWLQHIASRTGTAGSGGVRFFELDNEPALWNSTQRDVHPAPLSYDEEWQRTSQYAAAIKAQDANALVFGPSEWGWCGYFFSAQDGCSAGPDALAHGNEPLMDWYLDQLAGYQTAHGVRLLDYLDLHYYPQSTNVSLADDESAGTSALRLRSLKSLYDPTYVDESWIGQVVQLIPRMRQWVSTHYPGTKISIGEYNWGNDNGLSSALAQAEALAIFGREGVDAAARWVAPGAGTRVEDAFLLYLNYDGAGSKVVGSSAQALSSNVDAVGAYVVVGSSKLFLLLFNKDTVDRPVNVQIAGNLSYAISLFGFDAAQRLGSFGTTVADNGFLALPLPARSATLAVLTPTDPPTNAAYYTVTPCRLVDTRNPSGAFGGPSFPAGSVRTFSFAGQCGVPANAQSLALNVTVTQSSSAGDLKVYAAGENAPESTTISFNASATTANNAVVGVSQDGNAALSVLAAIPSGNVQVIVDVNGYFAAPP
jgi:hypothetical protein